MATLTLPDDSPLNVAEIDGDVGMIPRITVGEYHDLMRSVGLDEEKGWELIDGVIRRVDKSGPGEAKTVINPLHSFVTGRLADLRPRFRAHDCVLRVESPDRIGERDEPEPDAAIVVGSDVMYLTRHPTAAETLCVIEASDSSITFDLNKKLRRYATAGIRMYVVLRLRRGDAVVLTNPHADRYATRDELTVHDTLSLPTADPGVTIDVPLADLLPPAEAIG